MKPPSVSTETGDMGPTVATLQLDREGIVCACDGAAEQFFGCPAHEIIGKHFGVFYPTRPMADEADWVEQVLKGRSVEGVEAVQRANGDRFVKVRLSLTPTLDSTGEVETVRLDVRHASPELDAVDDERKLWTWAAVETAAEGIVTIGEQGLIEYVNPAAQDLFGYGPGDLVGQNISLLMPSPHKENHDGYIQQYCRTGEKKIIGIGREVLGLRRDGTVFPIHIAVSEVQFGDRRIFTGFVHDMTERKKNEERLRELSSRFEAILAAAPDIIIEVDADRRITWLNQAGLDFFGENVVRVGPADLLSGESESARQMRPLFDGDADAVNVENWQARKDGEKRLLAWCCRALRDEHGRVTGALSTARDITDDNTAKEEKDRLLQELNKRNREINCLYRVGEAVLPGELGPAAFTRTTNVLRISIVRPTLAGIRISIDESTYEDDEFQQAPWVLSADILASGRKRGTLEILFLQAELDPQTDPSFQGERNLIEGVVGLISEAIERSEAEAQVIQASKLASIGELAAGVGHEINNPVNGIINCADIILKEFEDGPTVRKFAELIRSEADRIATIVHNLLTFSRQDKEQHSPARLCDIIDAVLSLSNKKIEKSHIRLEVSVPQDLPRLRCRSEQLQQVFMNLVINSMHALDERYAGADPDKILRITAAERDVNGEPFVRVTVEDHGPGITEGNQQRMFNPFFTTKGRDKGTGLGLSISDGIVKDHGGVIECETQLGKYARFHVDLPLRFDAQRAVEGSTDAVHSSH